MTELQSMSKNDCSRSSTNTIISIEKKFPKYSQKKHKVYPIDNYNKNIDLIKNGYKI